MDAERKSDEELMAQYQNGDSLQSALYEIREENL